MLHDNQTANRYPLRVMFLTTSMPVGGAETLLMNLVRRLDRTRFSPEIVCLKERGPLGNELAGEIPVYSNLLKHKYDLPVLPRLIRLMRSRQAAVVVTVGAGDKMFWGRLAGRLAGVPVVLSALHSTGWPDSVGRLNRLLTPITDGFIGVADAHAHHLTEHERFPADKVFTIYNGVDVDRFVPGKRSMVREELGIPAEPQIVAILAALRPEKNHEFFLTGAERIRQQLPQAHFLVIGDGQRRSDLERYTSELGLSDCTHFVGSRADVPELLAASDLLTLTSHNEASPVSNIEALSCGLPVVSANVGSVAEIVLEGKNGFLYERGDLDGYVQHCLNILGDRPLRERLGACGRQMIVDTRSLDVMVEGYQSLMARIHSEKTSVESQPQALSAAPKKSVDLGAT